MLITPSQVHIKLPSPEVPRGKGVHASGIIRNIAIEMGILKGDQTEEAKQLIDVRDITDEVAILRMSLGLAWEEHYIGKVLAELGVVKHPGQICVDGVFMTPDGESVEKWHGKKTVLVIHEVKATYKSINTVADATKEWMYLTQLKCYCKGAKTRYARLHILFLCGDYKFPIRPVNKVFDIEFSTKEIEDNWSLMTDYRDMRS
jgi:hypothetical protein